MSISGRSEPSRRKLRRVTLACLLVALASPGVARVPEAAYADLRWRLVGRSAAAGRPCAAGVPGDPATFYFGAADGGVWKTTDAGVDLAADLRARRAAPRSARSRSRRAIRR